MKYQKPLECMKFLVVSLLFLPTQKYVSESFSFEEGCYAHLHMNADIHVYLYYKCVCVCTGQKNTTSEPSLHLQIIDASDV